MKYKCNDCDFSSEKSHGLAIHRARKHGDRGGNKDKAPAKRKYTRRKAQLHVVRFCPNCGCNLAAVEAALSL